MYCKDFVMTDEIRSVMEKLNIKKLNKRTKEGLAGLQMLRGLGDKFKCIDRGSGKPMERMTEAGFIKENAESLLPFKELGLDLGFDDDQSFPFKCKLDRNQFNKNASRKKMFKISILNAFYGRWGLSNKNKQQVQFFDKSNEDEVKAFVDCFNPSALRDVKDFNVLEKVYSLNYVDKTDNKQGRNSSLPIALFTTAYARIWLHRLMAKVGFGNILFCDTDSCCFKYKTTEKKIGKEVKAKFGLILLLANLGGLTDEMEGKGQITRFVALAPKLYAYEYRTPEGEYKYGVKAKGYTLDGITEQRINFENMEKIVRETFQERDKSIDEKIPLKGGLENINQRSSIKIKRHYGLYTKENKKIFGLNWINDKRQIDYTSDWKHIRTKPLGGVVDIDDITIGLGEMSVAPTPSRKQRSVGNHEE